jgi:hypothetical protein
LACSIFTAETKAKIPSLMIQEAKEKVIEIKAEIEELEKLKNRTYDSCLACLEPKEPLLKLPSVDPELLEEIELLEDLE